MTNNSKNIVCVLGAGFSKAFFPSAPLMVDDYSAVSLAQKFRFFKHASRIIDLERNRESRGRINIERLMTRIDGLMPYDFYRGQDFEGYHGEASEELGWLLQEVKKIFIERIQLAKDKPQYVSDLKAFAKYCVGNSINFVTFNYDDFLDEALWTKTGVQEPEEKDEPYWHPDGGYGFFCRPSRLCVEVQEMFMDLRTPALLLKLHGSMNWYPRRGYSSPYSTEAIMHHERWFSLPEEHGSTEEAIALHLGDTPFIVPPVLFKSELVAQPILRLVWHRAYEALRSANSVVFIGYSCPPTDIAAYVLFSESLEDIGRENIKVVNFARTRSEQERIIKVYQDKMGDIPEDQFDFRGALDWSRDLVAGRIHV
jgi:hypothetical protein